MSFAVWNSASTWSLSVTSTCDERRDVGAAELVDQLAPALVVDVADDDLGALLDEAAHGRQADARAASGDDGDLALDASCHVVLLPWSWSRRARPTSGSTTGQWAMKTFFSSVNAYRRVRAELAAEAGLLVAAERRPVADAGVRVDAEVAGLDAARDPQRRGRGRG